MQRYRRFAVVSMALLVLACTARFAQERKAMQLRVEPALFDEPRVEMAKSLPPQFSLTLSREMPTPGFSFTVDSVEVDPEARRIVARVTEQAPKGMVAQVLTPAWFKLDLGAIEPGRYFLELYLRDDPGAKHRPAQAVLLDAS